MAYYDRSDKTWVSTDPALPFIKVLAPNRERAEQQMKLLKAFVALGVAVTRLAIELQHPPSRGEKRKAAS
jgi:hypothetical protein